MDTLTAKEIKDKYGDPDWVGYYQNAYARKTQWFYHLGAGKVRYIFFVNDNVLWDWIITEEKMLKVIYDNNQMV